MPENRVLVLIPARMAATRLPGKPLLEIAGKPMIAHVCERALAAGSEVYVATDDERIAAAVAGLLAIAATIFLCYRYAERITSALGERGTNVLVRLSAFILLCIGIQIIWNGWRTLNAAG